MSDALTGDGSLRCSECGERVQPTDLAADWEIVMGRREWTVLDVCQRCVDASTSPAEQHRGGNIGT